MGINIVLVDGHDDDGTGLARHLIRDARLALLGTTTSVDEAARFLRFLEPDVVLVDAFGGPGVLIETCRRIRQLTAAPLVALASVMTADLWRALREAGANCYLLRQIDRDWPGRELVTLGGRN